MKIIKKIVCIITLASLTISLFACGSDNTTASSETVATTVEETKEAVAEKKDVEYLTRSDWDTFVKASLNRLMNKYGSVHNGGNPYVVFDFDNTCSIFDIEEQLAIYQLQVMAFAIAPDKLKDVLSTQLSDMDKDLSDLGYGKGSYNDWIADITSVYTKLYETYGPFTAAGLDEEAQNEIQKDDNWKEFATKMRAMYDLVYDNESASVAYPWVLYWFTGMTEDEVYDLAYASHSKYKAVVTTKVSWESPESIESKVGVVKYDWTSGTQVSENIKELWQALRKSGIDVWVCSASATSPIRAAIDVWGLHEYCNGVLAMTNKIGEDGKYINEYDYESGSPYTALQNDVWEKDTAYVTKAQTQGVGKVTAINNSLYLKYGHGPIAGFMDSTGDFNFCTEYSTLKLVCCFNRASRKVTDGGGLIAEVAVYEKDTLGYDFDKADENGDTLYVLQGRDENGMRTLRNSNKTLVLGSTEEKLFKNEDNEKQLQYMIDNKMSISDIINKFAIKTSADDSELGFKYGFLTEYAGYHSHD